MEEKYPEGHFIGMGMAIGIAIFSGFGVAIGVSTGNPGLYGIGPAVGVGFGLAIGKSIEDKYRKEGKIRPLTEKEKKVKHRAFIAGLIVLLLGIAAFLGFLFLK
jgi:multidrug efflux pump subunit AcrA (membrane-fusion protein)